MTLNPSHWAVRLSGNAFRSYPYASTMRACVAFDSLFRLSLLLIPIGLLVWLIADLTGIPDPPLYIIVALLLLDRILDRLIGFGRVDMALYEALFQSVVRNEFELQNIDPGEYYHRIKQPNRLAPEWSQWRLSLKKFHSDLEGKKEYGHSDAVKAAQILAVLLVATGQLFILLLAWALLRPAWAPFSGLHIAAQIALAIVAWLGISLFAGLGLAIPVALWLERAG